MSEIKAQINRCEALAGDIRAAEEKGWNAVLLDKATALEAHARALQIIAERSIARQSNARSKTR